MSETIIHTVAIIGAGPRGLTALEALVEATSGTPHGGELSILLLQQQGPKGAGPNHDPAQSEANWINISERAMDIPGRPAISGSLTIPAFPGYHDWAALDVTDKTQPDTFPPRAKLGTYLMERYESIARTLRNTGVLRELETTVTDIKPGDKVIELFTPDETYHVQEVLVCAGHQPVKPDKQLATWLQTDQDAQVSLFAEPYPVEEIVADLRPPVTVALRGYGLTMIDVIRAIAMRHGSFERNEDSGRLSYVPDHEVSITLIPFSKDGLPPVPKPFNALVDGMYAPSDTQLDALMSDVDHIIHRGVGDQALAVVHRIGRLAVSKFAEITGQEVDDPQALVSGVWNYMMDQVPHHTCTNLEQSPAELMANFVAMANGEVLPTLDFTLGQVWRHCHPTLYKLLDHSSLPDAAVVDFVGYDERMKQYTYGPPVESIEQLLALYDHGMLQLQYVKDPEIDITHKGWVLKSGSEELIATVMVNTVLADPDVAATTTDLINALCGMHGVSVYDQLGFKTDPAGCIATDQRLCVLGRLSKGSVLGTDAILECFNDQPRRWAAGLLERL